MNTPSPFWTTQRFVFFAAVQAALALAMMRWSVLATIHAWGTLLVGVYLACSSKRLVPVACFASYVAGAEVLWRMTEANAFWEMGKYTVVASLGIALLRHPPIRTSVFPWIFALAFGPSCLMTLMNMPLGEARGQISFNLSGPLALAVSAAFFLRMRLTSVDLRAVVLTYLVPLLGISAIVVTSIANAEELVFTHESNSSLSGGYGPNQVSSVLGFGCIASLALAVALLPPRQKMSRLLFFLLAMLLGAQSALTFSRSGIYLAALSVGIAAIASLHHRETRRILIVSTLATYVIARFLILPQLDAFTHGTLSERFGESGFSGRDLLMKSDLAVWQAHPILGVGPGRAIDARAEFFTRVAAHSEFTRALAEHGILGLLALLYLVIDISKNIIRINSSRTQFIVAAFAAFGLLFMVSNAMRIVLCSVVVGISFGTFTNTIKRHPFRRKLSFRIRPGITECV